MPTDDQRAHDVLAAEEFGVPAPDPELHHGPVRLPDDPTGIPEPHDVLAAEEFALPAPGTRAVAPQGPASWPQAGTAGPGFTSALGARRALVTAAALALLMLSRRRRARARKRHT
jgi:hypothetical protein